MKHILLILTSIFCMLQVQAQGLKGSMELEKDIKRGINEVEKPLPPFQKFPRNVNTSEVSYEFDWINFATPEASVYIPPAALNSSESVSLYPGYVKAGFANYITGYLEAAYQSVASKKFDYGVKFRHYSAQEGAVFRKLSASSENNLDVYGSWYNEHGKAFGNIYYDRQGTHFYGFEGSSESVEKADIKQIYNRVGGTLGYDWNHTKVDGLTAGVKADMYSISDRLNAKESYLKLYSPVEYRLDGANRIQGNLGITFSNYKNINTDGESIDRSRPLTKVALKFAHSDESLHFRVGAKCVYSGDTISADKNIYVYPEIYGEYKISEDLLSGFVSLEGDLNSVTLNNIADRNLWVGENLDLLHENKKIDALVGVRIRPNVWSMFKLWGGYELYQNKGFFVNDPSDIAKFVMVYSDDNVGVAHLDGSVNVAYRNFRGSWNSRLQFFNVDESMQAAWHEPSWKSELGLTYDSKPWNVSTTILHMAGMTARGDAITDVNGATTFEEINLKGIFDMGAKVSYQINQQWTAFAEGTNLFSQKYERYHQYHLRGIQVMGGVHFAF